MEKVLDDAMTTPKTAVTNRTTENCSSAYHPQRSSQIEVVKPRTIALKAISSQLKLKYIQPLTFPGFSIASSMLLEATQHNFLH